MKAQTTEGVWVEKKWLEGLKHLHSQLEHDHEILVNTILETKKQEREELLKSLVEEVGGIEKETSIHDGHSTSDGWCYTCQKTTNDGTEPNGIGIYNQALKDIIKVIKKHQE